MIIKLQNTYNFDSKPLTELNVEIDELRGSDLKKIVKQYKNTNQIRDSRSVMEYIADDDFSSFFVSYFTKIPTNVIDNFFIDDYLLVILEVQNFLGKKLQFLTSRFQQ